MIDEQDAVRRCQMGDHEAFRPIVERYGNVLMGAIYLMTHDRAVSEELVQETFVRAWKGIGTFRLGQPVKPWLIRIAVNQALNAKARGQTPVEPLSEAEHGGSADPGFARADDRDEVRRALSRLSADHRRIVVLRYFPVRSFRQSRPDSGKYRASGHESIALWRPPARFPSLGGVIHRPRLRQRPRRGAYRAP